MPALTYAIHHATDPVTADTVPSDYDSMMKLSLDERSAIADKAINDYLSGKTRELVIPGAKKVVVPQILPAKQPNLPRVPAPDYVNATRIQSKGELSPTGYGEWLPAFYNVSPVYSATYLQFGGPGYGTNASCANAKFNYAYTGSDHGLPALGPSAAEIFVMHLWGQNLTQITPSDAGITENNIVITRNWTLSNTVDFWYYSSGYGNDGYRFLIATQLPITHRISADIMALNPQGSSVYTQIQVCVFDATTMTWYQPNNINTPHTQIANVVDMALEATSSYTANLAKWRVAESYVAYNVNQNVVNLLQYGRVFYWYTPSLIFPVVDNGYYFDTYPYGYPTQTPNGMANIFITRFTYGYPLPPHP